MQVMLPIERRPAPEKKVGRDSSKKKSTDTLAKKKSTMLWKLERDDGGALLAIVLYSNIKGEWPQEPLLINKQRVQSSVPHLQHPPSFGLIGMKKQ
jgi:hypothetical protein